MKNVVLIAVGFSFGAAWCACKTLHTVACNQKIREAVTEEAADWLVNKLCL